MALSCSVRMLRRGTTLDYMAKHFLENIAVLMVLAELSQATAEGQNNISLRFRARLRAHVPD